MVQLLRQLTTDNLREKLNFQKYVENKFCKWAWLKLLQTVRKVFNTKLYTAKLYYTTRHQIKVCFINFFLVSIVLRNSQLSYQEWWTQKFHHFRSFFYCELFDIQSCQGRYYKKDAFGLISLHFIFYYTFQL